MTQAVIIAPSYTINTGDFAARPIPLRGAPDAALLDAERDLAAVMAMFDDWATFDEGVTRFCPVIEAIMTTPPQTLAGIAAKLRTLCDRNVGIPADLYPDAIIVSLRQILTAVEKMQAA